MTDTDTTEAATDRPTGLKHDLPNECLFCGGPNHPKVTDCPDYPHYLNLPAEPTPGLRSLRKEARERQVKVFQRDGMWFKSAYNDILDVWMERVVVECPHGAAEKDVLLTLFGYK